MKKSVAIACLTLFATILAGESVSIEVKYGNGRIITEFDGSSPKSKYTSYMPWVCYKKRIKVVVDGEIYLKYKGCFRTDISCKALGYAHFGKYPNDYEANKALKRCINSTPRFID